jgi:hypothetical protein
MREAFQTPTINSMSLSDILNHAALSALLALLTALLAALSATLLAALSALSAALLALLVALHAALSALSATLLAALSATLLALHAALPAALFALSALSALAALAALSALHAALLALLALLTALHATLPAALSALANNETTSAHLFTASRTKGCSMPGLTSGVVRIQYRNFQPTRVRSSPGRMALENRSGQSCAASFDSPSKMRSSSAANICGIPYWRSYSERSDECTEQPTAQPFPPRQYWPLMSWSASRCSLSCVSRADFISGSLK